MFPTHLSSASVVCTTWGNRKPGSCVFYLDAVYQKTHEYSINYATIVIATAIPNRQWLFLKYHAQLIR